MFGVEYTVLESVSDVEGVGKVHQYGLHLQSEDGEMYFPELSTSRMAVERFGALLQKENAAFCHWKDLVEDFLPLEYYFGE